MMEEEMPRVEQWRDMASAPDDGTEILYLTKYEEIGFCYWSKAGGPFDCSMWWDDALEEEVCPVRWLPRDVLPPFPTDLGA
jgi:hypothetical protein